MTSATAQPKADQSQVELARRMLRQMLLIRRFEEKAAEAYALGKIGGFCHLYIGQEAVAAGSLAALRLDDYVISSYREHGQALVRGVSAPSPRGSASRSSIKAATRCACVTSGRRPSTSAPFMKR